MQRIFQNEDQTRPENQRFFDLGRKTDKKQRFLSFGKSRFKVKKEMKKAS